MYPLLDSLLKGPLVQDDAHETLGHHAWVAHLNRTPDYDDSVVPLLPYVQTGVTRCQTAC